MPALATAQEPSARTQQDPWNSQCRFLQTNGCTLGMESSCPALRTCDEELLQEEKL